MNKVVITKVANSFHVDFTGMPSEKTLMELSLFGVGENLYVSMWNKTPMSWFVQYTPAHDPNDIRKRLESLLAEYL